MTAKFHDIFKGKTVIVGIGNILKGDDAFGSLFVEKLKGKVKAVCIDAGISLESYAGKIVKESPDTILFVDACHLGLKPGEYRILKPEEILKSGFTTHDLSPRVVIEYLKGETRADIYMLGVQPENISLGSEMSAAVRRTLDIVTSTISRSTCPKERRKT